jgi:CheY-like chemotaxis protein
MRRYLIVDDNVALAENLAEIVRDAGDEAVVAASGAEALASVARERFDAILTDLRMPGMDGAELAREVKRTDPGVPAIVITAFAKDAGLRAAEREGPLAVLPKPVPVAQLLQLLAVARRNARILLVEDDAVFADNLRELLQDRGFAVVRVGSVGEVEDLSPDRPLLALVDLRVPGGADGMAAERLVARFPEVPLLVATAHRDAAIPGTALHVFLKPFDPGELLAVVESMHRAAAVP